MRTSTRRKLDIGVVVGAGLVAGAAALVGAYFGHGEQVAGMWALAQVADDGSAQVTEVIDYDFGSSIGKHGIFRVVPGLALDAPVSVSSDDEPEDVEITPVAEGTRLRIGDPATTVSGDHRYRIDYPLAGVARGTTLDWDAVGTTWEVGIAEAEIHVVAPFELLDVQCFEGFRGSNEPCEVRQVEPGHLVALIDGLEAGEGVSLEGRTGSDLPVAPALPELPTERPTHPGTGLLPPVALAAAGVLVAGLPVLRIVRRAGRETVAVGPGGPADAAWAGATWPGGAWSGTTGTTATGTADAYGRPDPTDGINQMRVDHGELAQMATVEFAPPSGLSPPQGGIVLDETVRPNHQVAWLIQAAIDGSVELVSDGTGDDVPPTWLVRRGPGTPETAPILDAAFNGRSELCLGTYDQSFASAWRWLHHHLAEWRGASGLWDARADTRRLVVRAVGVLGAALGLVGLVAGAAAANRWGPGWLPVAALGGMIAGAGVAAAIAAWELHVRTVTGSAAWLRVESFRRFLAESEAYHAEEAARRGVLREYTAWAVALGEIDRWSRAVGAATSIPDDAGLHYVHVAPALYSVAAATATPPSSSGGGFGGGGGGGSVGGGAGGGGGGSW